MDDENGSNPSSNHTSPDKEKKVDDGLAKEAALRALLKEKGLGAKKKGDDDNVGQEVDKPKAAAGGGGGESRKSVEKGGSGSSSRRDW